MADFKRSRERKPRSDSRRGFRSDSPRSGSGRRSGFSGSRGRRDSDDKDHKPFDRNRSGGSKNRRDFEMTKVICSRCGEECEVPFKPTSNKPVFCSDCFSKEDSSRSFGRDSRSPGRDSGSSSRDFEIINKKLDKIMRALDIE